MGLFQTAKPKSAAKVMLTSGENLQSEVLGTLSHIAKLAGATLGPGGRQVLIERAEMNMKPIITKDGVTVVKSLGYDSAVKQLILEAARDAAIRTASEAGDGTTSATILSNSIAQSTAEIVKLHPKMSPQKIVREMQSLVPFLIEKIKKYKIDPNADDAENILLKVAELSANGDTELASAILEGFNLVGEEGNLTIIESVGPSRYSLERISGYTVDRGYEDSCRNFANGFLNDKSGTMIVLDNPVFLLYDGIISDINQILDPLAKLGDYFRDSKRANNGAVLVAHGFSNAIVGDLHVNWNHPQSTVKVVPLQSPDTIISNGKTQFLYDLQAYTGAPVFNPIDKPLTDLDPEKLVAHNRAKQFECSRFRSSVMVNEDPDLIEIRVDELRRQLERPESQYEENDLRVRIGKLSSGIARLTICGASTGETREKRDRAEDAWMALRGAIKHGAIPGGGYALVRLAADMSVAADQLTGPAQIACEILSNALLQPVRVLYSNYGYNDQEIEEQIKNLLIDDERTFDISNQKWVKKHELLDSVPAVVEAIRNSISISSLLGTIGGIVAFKRDGDADKEEQRFARNFERAIESE